MIKKRKVIDRKRGPLDRAVDTSIKKPLFVLEIYLPTTYNLEFLRMIVLLCYRHFLYAFNDTKK